MLLGLFLRDFTGFFGGLLIEAHWLALSAVSSIDGDSLAAELIGQSEGVFDGGK